MIKLNIQRFAVQADDTLVTKGDLKTLYNNKIQPYLGGNYLIRTNNSDFYSTDEKVVGVWVNGKPIYQKTWILSISLVIPNDSSNLTWVIADVTSLNIDEMVNFLGSYFSNGGNQRRCMPGVAPLGTSGTDWMTVNGMINGDGTLQIQARRTNNSSVTLSDIKVTIQYTKTTDTATSALTTPGAYDLARPDLWPANKEIFFGNGLYGYRATGTITKEANLITRTILINETFSSSAKIVSYGGYWSITINSHIMKFSVSGARTDSYAYSSFLEMEPNDISITSTAYVARNNNPYDIWVTYTK